MSKQQTLIESSQDTIAIEQSKVPFLRNHAVHYDVELHGSILDRHTSYKKALDHFRTVQHDAVKLMQHIMATGERRMILTRIAS